ncbi:MAG: hypothetical protein LAT81_09185, partial [Oceanicaulis sp.]|nr:hypothetical protein [Oceanicaulis sp.]
MDVLLLGKRAASGIADFPIRGIGINSSIPSADPTVAVFIDGVYQGINAGRVFANFDLERVEVLRGRGDRPALHRGGRADWPAGRGLSGKLAVCHSD